MTACHCATVSPSSVPNSLRVRRVGIVSRLLLQDTTGTQGNTCCGIHLYLKKYISIVFQLKGKNKLYTEKGKKILKCVFFFVFTRSPPRGGSLQTHRASHGGSRGWLWSRKEDHSNHWSQRVGFSTSNVSPFVCPFSSPMMWAEHALNGHRGCMT